MRALNPEEIEDVYHDSELEAAREILMPLAEGGDPIAQFYVGHLCDEETPSNQAAALAWYKKSSDGGYLEGTHYLASFLYHGFGAPPDVDLACLLLERAANQGLDASQWKLGQHLLQSPSRRSEAVHWLSLAAEQGHPAAIELLEGIDLERKA